MTDQRLSEPEIEALLAEWTMRSVSVVAANDGLPAMNRERIKSLGEYCQRLIAAIRQLRAARNFAPWKASYTDMRNQRDALAAQLAEAQGQIARRIDELSVEELFEIARAAQQSGYPMMQWPSVLQVAWRDALRDALAAPQEPT